MILSEIGLITLVIAFGLAVYAAGASAWGGKRGRWEFVESARSAALLVFPLLTIAVVILVVSLLTLDFRLAYVADVSSRVMSPFLRVTALWGGQQGSLLFWAWLMAGYVGTVMLRKWNRDRELMPYVVATSMVTTAFFIGLVVFISNPFARLWHVEGAQDLTTAVFQPANSMAYVPEDGGGLNPLLRHFGMIGHPPTTYLGFTGFVIPFSFAIAALITGKAREDEWIRTTRRWTLVAWCFLSIGLILGGRWAYDVLGWGGFWGWDPVENAMLMPWLTGTAFVHSVMVAEKRGMLKVWNMILIILTYALSLFGTFITRTGVIGSVHAFAKSALGPAFFLFIGLTFLGSLGLLFRHLKDLKTEHEMDSLVSREAAYLLQNVLFLAITFAVFWGTVFPMISELVTGTRITVGPPYFRQVTGPLFFVLVLLMAVAPTLSWRKQNLRAVGKAIRFPLVLSLLVAAGWAYLHRVHPGSWAALWLVSFSVTAVGYEYWKGVHARREARGENAFLALQRLVTRNRRRYGGYIVHLGVAMVMLGFVGDSHFKLETQGTVGAGQSLNVGSYSLRFDGLRFYPGSDGREIVEATTRLFRGDQPVAELRPRRDYFIVQEQPVTVPAVYSTPGEDVYVLLVGWEEIAAQSTTFKIYVNSLINWTWLGGVVLALGILISAWPSSSDRTESRYRIRPVVPRAMAGPGG